MFDLEKLKTPIDIKDIDASALLTKALGKHQNALINLVLIAGSLLLAAAIYNDHHSKEQVFLKQGPQVQMKLDAVKARDASLKELNDYKSALPPKLNVFDLIANVQTYAKLYDINVNILSPSDTQDKGIYDYIDIDFNGTSDDFKKIALFLRKIEGPGSSLRMESWNGHSDDDGKITFQIVFRSVRIHS